MPRQLYPAIMRLICAMAMLVPILSGNVAVATAGAPLDAASLPAKLAGKVEGASVSLLSKVLGIKIQVSCTAGELLNAKLVGKGQLSTGFKAKFTGCKAVKAGTSENLSGCFPHSTGQLEKSGIIETNKLKGEIVSHEGAALVAIQAETGEEFVNILMGEICAVGESLPLFGKLFLKDTNGEFEAHTVAHLLEQGPLTKLYVITDIAEHLETSIDGSASFSLTEAHLGLKWGAMQPIGGSAAEWLILD
jgi:hypothetical protein